MPSITKLVERWFDYPKDPLGGRVLIHHLTPGEIKKITTETYKRDVSYKEENGKLVPSVKEKADTDKNIEMTLFASLLNWENFFKEDGTTPLKYSEKNIILCADRIEGFSEFITDCRKKLAADIADEKEKQLKN